MSTEQRHWKFQQLFGGDPKFELKVLRYLKDAAGTASLLRVGEGQLLAAVNDPEKFRERVMGRK